MSFRHRQVKFYTSINARNKQTGYSSSCFGRPESL
jgi:hypothetical protein